MTFFIFFFIFLQLIITGCSTVPGSKVEELRLREAAVQMYRYQGLRDEVIVEPPKLSSGTVSPGDKLSMELKITVLSPEKEKQFKVLEVMTLSGADVLVELIRQESERPQGLHFSTFQFLIPKDLPPGSYTLVISVAAEDQQITKRIGFQVKK
jgi:hypothetical protein